jgi:hypothetical protein
MSLFCCPSCGLPAEDIHHFVVDSSDGPIEYYHACCIQLHRFTIPASTVAERIEIELTETEASLPEPAPEPHPAQSSSPPAGVGADIAPAPPSRSPLEAGEAAPGLTHLPPPHTTVDTLRAPRTRLAAGAFFAGGLSSGFLLSVPVVLAFAVVLGLMAVAVIASLVPMALASRRAGRGQVAPLDRYGTGAAGPSSGEGRRAA